MVDRYLWRQIDMEFYCFSLNDVVGRNLVLNSDIKRNALRNKTIVEKYRMAKRFFIVIHI